MPKVIEYDEFIELADAGSGQRIYISAEEPGYLTVGMEVDNGYLNTDRYEVSMAEQYEVSMPAIDIIRFFDEVIKKFDGT